jgi:SAM-dependent methyltransferase
MNVEQAKRFYKEQFNMFKDLIDLETPYLPDAEQIIEQVGRPFTTVLELGAGNGLLARSLATFDKKITTVELVPEMVVFARKFKNPNIQSLCGSFYEIELTDTFDTVLYIDGFGVGTDEDQIQLLQRIYNWLNDDGVALIDIYQPEYWKKVSGQKMTPIRNSNVLRIYGYDEKHNKMTDTWWYEDKPNEKYTQSLACYTPDKIYEMCKKANLTITAYFPGGAMDFEKWEYKEVVGLSECLSYRIKVKKRK